jgi:hypothetical protein
MGMQGIAEPPPNMDHLGIYDNMPYQDDPEIDEREIIEHTIEAARVRGICFWRPPGVDHNIPIVTANVKQCNRFEEKQKDNETD